MRKGSTHATNPDRFYEKYALDSEQALVGDAATSTSMQEAFNQREAITR